MPPIRTHSPSPDTTPTESRQPRRPPNAWILFRTAMVKAMPSPAPGEPALPQAEKSKIIAKMWQEASEEVRAYYDHLSGVSKAEHKAKYPNYRFQPMKKADKERLRAEKLAEKERLRATRKARPRTRARALPSVSQDPPPLFTTTPRHGLPGLPPPTSIASTPPVNFISGPSMLVVTPPSDHSTPSGPSFITPVPSSSRFSPPPPPSMTAVPPLFVPQPGLPQRPLSVSGWHPSHHAQTPLDDAAYIDFLSESLPSQYLPPPCGIETQHTFNPVENPPTQQSTWNVDETSMLSTGDAMNNQMLYVYGTGEVFDGQQVFDEGLGVRIDSGAFVNADPSALGTVGAIDSVEDTASLQNAPCNFKAIEELLACLDAMAAQQLVSDNVAGLSQPLNDFAGAPAFTEASNVFPEASNVFPEASNVFPEASNVFPEASNVFPEADPS